MPSLASSGEPVGPVDPSPKKAGVLDKAFVILDAFGASDYSLSLAEITNRTGLPKSTAHRVLQSLVKKGALSAEDGRFRLGTRLFELGQLVPQQRALREVVLPFMQDLCEATHETIHLGVMDGFDVLYVAKTSGHRRAGAPTREGGRIPLHCTALGKAMLSFSPPGIAETVIDKGLPAMAPRTITVPSVFEQTLTAIRDRGVAFDHEEAQVGISCVAAPILDADGITVAALSITGPTPRVNLSRLAPAIHATTLAVGRAISKAPHR